jgi:hypothetical protein
LYDFELLASGAHLTDEQKCDYILSYCTEREAKFIRTLESWHNRIWFMLKADLLSYYPAEHKEKIYHL